MIFKENEFESTELCGVDLKSLKGTIRQKVDYDDAWFFYLAKHHQVIFDIGANVGYTALLAMIQNGLRRYVLLDPNPLAIASASQNLLMNGFGMNASFVNSFVSDKEKNKIKFYTVGTGAAGSMFASHAKTAAKLNQWFYVDTTTVDSLVDNYHLIPDLVKIDVEGAEYLVLEGAKALARNQKTFFFVEMHALAEVTMEENAKNILAWCNEVSYNAWYMSEAKIMITPEIIAHRGKCHLLLIPKEMEYPLYLKGIKQGNALPNSIERT